MVTVIAVLVQFVLSLLVSGILIYVVTKALRQKEGVGTALGAALVGSVIYAGAYFFLGTGILAALVGGVVWLIALGSLYEMGWTKAFAIAFIVWFLATVIGTFLPTLTGPL
ncbi:MAG: hypothetical protein HY369_00970 [Candidatus Aenigmarchaeota archaeon]|nr:hypothetical protein [Candidatus Aenigmarchaeota archaeon]